MSATNKQSVFRLRASGWLVSLAVCLSLAVTYKARSAGADNSGDFNEYTETAPDNFGDSVDEIYVSYNASSASFRLLQHRDDFTVAHAWFNNSINSTGFGYLSIKTFNRYTYKLNSSVQAYAAGLAEGFLTRDLIALHYQNTFGNFCQAEGSLCQELRNFLRENLQWVFTHVSANYDDEFWYQVRLFYEQLRGLQDGILGKPGKISMDVDDVFGIYLLQIQYDVEDISKALSGMSHLQPSISHCSALLKVLPSVLGVKDVLVAHDTWSYYNCMLRVLKRYDFYYHKYPTVSEPVLGHTWTFSSYPGTIVSHDDFYVLSSAMVTTETTNQIYADDLFKKIRPQCVLESVRAVVANRLAEHGDDWSNIFSKYNSGTYNNQWMIIDFKMYDEYFQKILPGFLTVLEQIPGYVHYEDMTDVLLKTSYWASYNVPYFPEIFNKSGWPEMVSKYGDFFSYDQTSRAEIFRRDQSKVVDYESMTRLMRSNDFQHDPLSQCNCTPPYSGINAISARCDLNPQDGQYPLPLFGFRLGGGTDMKLTSIAIAEDALNFMAISGPTYNPLPPFQWSTAVNGSSMSHFGQPDLFQFGPIWFNGTH